MHELQWNATRNLPSRHLITFISIIRGDEVGVTVLGFHTLWSASHEVEPIPCRRFNTMRVHFSEKSPGQIIIF